MVWVGKDLKDHWIPALPFPPCLMGSNALDTKFWNCKALQLKDNLYIWETLEHDSFSQYIMEGGALDMGATLQKCYFSQKRNTEVVKWLGPTCAWSVCPNCRSVSRQTTTPMGNVHSSIPGCSQSSGSAGPRALAQSCPCQRCPSTEMSNKSSRNHPLVMPQFLQWCLFQNAEFKIQRC